MKQKQVVLMTNEELRELVNEIAKDKLKEFNKQLKVVPDYDMGVVFICVKEVQYDEYCKQNVCTM